MKIAIIGAGASGLVAGLFASKNNDVTIYCADEKIGKKILVTGNGKCNLTNIKGFDTAYNQDVSKFFEKISNLDIIKFFNNLGLEIYVDEEGRVYPLANSAQSVVEVLTNALAKDNVNIKFEKVEDIKIDTKFNVITNLSNEEYDKVIIATGSENVLLDKMKIKYKPFSPSLVALKTKENTKELSGLRLTNVKVTLDVDNKKYTEFGEVLFKDKGLSGICIFNISAYLARKNNFNAKIYIDLLPKFTYENVVIMLTNRLKLNFKNISEFMTGLFNKKINKYLLKNLNLDEQKNIKELNSNIIEKIAKIIKNLPFNVVGYYENNQVKSGGVRLCDLTENCEYKDIKNLYFIGEVVDVDGLCGGYNLSWAFVSAMLAGEDD